MPRPRGEGPRVPELVPAPRDEGVPLRRGQHAGLYLPLSWLELRHRRQARRGALFPRGLSREARQIAVGLGRGPAIVLLQGHGVGLLGPRGAVVFRISRRFRPLSRSDVGRLGRQRGRHRNPGRHPEMADPVQLEIPGGEFLRRQLPQHQPPLGRSGRHRPLRQRAARHAGAADGPPAAGLVL